MSFLLSPHPPFYCTLFVSLGDPTPHVPYVFSNNYIYTSTICTYNCLSANLLISPLISMKFAPATLLCMLYLWNKFQLKTKILLNAFKRSFYTVSWLFSYMDPMQTNDLHEISDIPSQLRLCTSLMSLAVHTVMYIKT